MDKIFENLKTLTSVDGTSGDESRVASAILKIIEGKYTSYEIDPLGNLIVFKEGKNRPNGNIMIAAHMDEVGFVVTNIDKSGMLNFVPVGGIDTRTMLGQRIRLRNEKTNEIIYGVIGYKSIHLVKDSSKMPEQDEIMIDIGAKDEDEAKKYAYPSMRGTFDSEFMEFGNDKIKSKALDDRVGCTVMMEIICNDELEYDTYFAFTTQEEVGCKGATVAAYTIEPKTAIIIEGTVAADTGNTPVGKEVCMHGKGAAISFMDNGTIYSKDMFDLAFELAEKENITVQPKTRIAAQNDSKVVQVTKSGSRVLAISLPCRYIHSQSSSIKKSDLVDTYKIVSSMLKHIGK